MNELKVKDWKDFNDFIENLKLAENHKFLARFHFRGQSVLDWDLSSGITRVVSGNSLSEKKAHYYEQQSIMEFNMIAHLYNERLSYENGDSELTHLIDMQHYSCPTRLLDWTISPFVGLYFAVGENFTDDASLFAWDTNFYTSVCDKLYGESDLSFDRLVKLKKYDKVQIMLSAKLNERAYRQQGTFSISNNLLKPHCEIIDGIHQASNTSSSLTKVIISKDLKLEFLDRLHFMNITANSLFPGLDGIGKEIKHSLLLRKWKGR